MSSFEVSQFFYLKKINVYTKVNKNIYLPFENWQSCCSLGRRHFSAQPIYATYKRGENLVSADFKQSPFKKEEFPNFSSLSRNVEPEASVRSRFDQEHKLPEEKRSSLSLDTLKFRISVVDVARAYDDDVDRKLF